MNRPAPLPQGVQSDRSLAHNPLFALRLQEPEPEPEPPALKLAKRVGGSLSASPRRKPPPLWAHDVTVPRKRTISAFGAPVKSGSGLVQPRAATTPARRKPPPLRTTSRSSPKATAPAAAAAQVPLPQLSRILPRPAATFAAHAVFEVDTEQAPPQPERPATLAAAAHSQQQQQQPQQPPQRQYRGIGEVKLHGEQEPDNLVPTCICVGTVFLMILVVSLSQSISNRCDAFAERINLVESTNKSAAILGKLLRNPGEQDCADVWTWFLIVVLFAAALRLLYKWKRRGEGGILTHEETELEAEQIRQRRAATGEKSSDKTIS